MNILVIKTTSLGDVLHATPHLSAIRQRYPDAHITVLVARTSAEIYAHHPAVDRLVRFDHAGLKQAGLHSPRASLALFRAPLSEINDREYDLAFDLQGLARTVVFLYFAHARRKFVKGRWPGLEGFRNRRLHAIDEMSEVLALADIPVPDTQLRFYRSPDTAASLREKLATNGLGGVLGDGPGEGFIVISPFTRWASKNWPLTRFIDLASRLAVDRPVLITAAEDDRQAIGEQLAVAVKSGNVHSLAGMLSLPELAELMSHAALVVSGDSFPMHLATAVQAPLVTLFGPTDERKTGPRMDNSLVLRPDQCERCDRPDCSRACLGQISVERVEQAARQMLREHLAGKDQS